MSLFERSPEEWADYYLYDKRPKVSKNMRFGSDLADGLEAGEATGDPLLDLMASKLPKFELMDIPVVAWLKDKKEEIQLLAKPDTCKADYSAFKEYKTSVRKWTQKMVDESNQITFYAMVIWLKTGKIPQDIELVDVQTAYTENGGLTVTGEMWRFPTKRSMTDIIKMTARARRTWAGIKKLVEQELL